MSGDRGYQFNLVLLRWFCQFVSFCRRLVFARSRTLEIAEFDYGTSQEQASIFCLPSPPCNCIIKHQHLVRHPRAGSLSRSKCSFSPNYVSPPNERRSRKRLNFPLITVTVGPGALSSRGAAQWYGGGVLWQGRTPGLLTPDSDRLLITFHAACQVY